VEWSAPPGRPGPPRRAHPPRRTDDFSPRPSLGAGVYRDWSHCWTTQHIALVREPAKTRGPVDRPIRSRTVGRPLRHTRRRAWDSAFVGSKSARSGPFTHRGSPPLPTSTLKNSVGRPTDERCPPRPGAQHSFPWFARRCGPAGARCRMSARGRRWNSRAAPTGHRVRSRRCASLADCWRHTVRREPFPFESSAG